MKKQKIFFAFILLCCAIISGCYRTTLEDNKNNENGEIIQIKNTTEIPTEITTEITTEIKNIEYQNKKYNFKIQIPNTRTFQENINGFNIEIKTPKNDSINENLGIVVQELQTEETLESFTKKTIEGLKELYEDYNEITKENIEINSNEGITLTYEISENGYKIKAQQTAFLKDNKSYVFQYTATKDTFDNYINEINNIVNSFTLLD